MNVAEPPVRFAEVLSTSFVMFQLYVRLYAALAVLLTVRSRPVQTVTVAVELPLCVEFGVWLWNEAVFGCCVHCPGVPLSVTSL